MRESSWCHGVTRYQWFVLFVAWLGWVFDSMDSTIYALVLHPALHDLLGARAGGAVSQEAIGWYGGIILSIFLIGWAIGGVVFGVLADRFGRTKTLVFTILIYAVFTGLAALSSSWWQLALYRFLTALGIGGEWAAGAALVAEVWPEEKRAKAAGMLQSAWAAGFLFAAVVSLLLREHGWRRFLWSALRRRWSRSSCGCGSKSRSAGSRRMNGSGSMAATARNAAGAFPAQAAPLDAGRFGAGVCGGVRLMGRDELDADAGPRRCPGCKDWTPARSPAGSATRP